MQKDTKGNVYFKKTDGIYVLDPDVMTSYSNKTHTISIGVGTNYVVLKPLAQPYIYLMSSCATDEYFDSDNFLCRPCSSAHRSFGLQNTNCYPCNSLWMMSSRDGDYLQWAQYQMLCTEGQVKSIGVIVGTIVLILIIGMICCCQNRYIEKKLRKLEALRTKTKKTAEEKNM
jgi:hypothetical protein